MQNYVDYPNREAWLKGRINSLGASEVSSVLGKGFQSSLELWKIKTGKVEPKDLSDIPRVRYGTEAEEHLRALFSLKNADKYRIEYFPYRVFNHSKYPYLTCTLDGIIIQTDYDEENYLSSDIYRKYGVWECKTVWITSSRELEQWNGKIPDKYYIQVLQQLAITDFSFAIITAELILPDGNSEIRNYMIERTKQVENDIQHVIKEAVEFWTKYVIPNKEPPIKMIL